MGYEARVHKVMIACPSDITVEPGLIRDAIDDWNAVHAERLRCMLLPLHWRSNSSPRMGDRPQAILNRQLVEKADLLVAVFWTRLGTPTGVADSGTVEEINEHLAAGKPAMIYFCTQPVAEGSVDHEQFEALLTYRTEIENRGLLSVYSSREEFTREFPRHLAQTVLDELCTEPSDVLPGEQVAQDVPVLTDDAIRLLNEAAEDKNGTILVARTLGGTHVQTNGIGLTELGNSRSEARWLEAINDLFAAGLLTGSPDGVSNLTAEGYRVADSVAVWWRLEGAPRFRLNLASSRGEPAWTFDATVTQFDGSDIGSLTATWSGAALVETTGRFTEEGTRKWRLPTAIIDPARAATPTERAVVIEVAFRWQGQRRRMSWEWTNAADFQRKEAELTRS